MKPQTLALRPLYYNLGLDLLHVHGRYTIQPLSCNPLYFSLCLTVSTSYSRTVQVFCIPSGLSDLTLFSYFLILFYSHLNENILKILSKPKILVICKGFLKVNSFNSWEST